MTPDQLPCIDEHAVTVAATPEATWDAVLESLRTNSAVTRVFARVLACDPVASSAPDPVVGSTIPGFRIVEAGRPDRLVLAGRHRFARYAIVLRIEPDGEGARCRLASRAEFPGLHGRLYRLAVIGSRAHVVAVRRMLGGFRRAAERRSQAASP